MTLDPDLLRSLPKVSLHDHLDGGLRPATVFEIAAEIGHPLPADSAEAPSTSEATSASSPAASSTSAASAPTAYARSAGTRRAASSISRVSGSPITVAQR